MDGNSKMVIPPAVATLPVGAAARIGAVVGPNYSVVIDGIVIANITAVARTFDLYLHASTAAAAAGNAICVAVNVNAYTLYTIAGPFYIPAGWQLSGLASAATSINVTLTGYLINETVY